MPELGGGFPSCYLCVAAVIMNQKSAELKTVFWEIFIFLVSYTAIAIQTLY